MKKEKIPVTSAVRELRRKDARFEAVLYKFEDGAVADKAAEQLGLDPHLMVKTLVMEDELRRPFLVLMHGDMQVSTKNMARILGVKSVALCDEATAHRHTGYVRGGTSPFGTLKTLPTYMESTISGLSELFINGGKRGLMIRMQPSELVRVLQPTLVNVAIPG